MRALFVSSFAALAFMGVVSNAWAGPAEERAAALQICRAEISTRAGVEEAAVRLDSMRERSSLYRIDFDLWTGGQLTNVRCEVARGAEPTITALNLPEGSVQAAR